MTDNEIKQMLETLQRDLMNPNVEKAQWTHRQFIPLEKRQQNIKILNIAHFVSLILILVVSAYVVLFQFQDDRMIQIFFGGFVLLMLIVSSISWHKKFIPMVLNNQYALFQYRLNFKQNIGNLAQCATCRQT